MAWQGAVTIVASLVIALLSRSTEGGVTPKACSNRAVDILFIKDCSSSIALSDYLQMLNFSAQLSSAFTVGPNDVQFAGMVFSTTAYNMFGFRDHLTNAGVKAAILNLTYYGGGTSTGDALRLARTYSFTQANGARPNVPHITVLYTDGKSYDTVNTTLEASLLRNSGVLVLAISVGSAGDVDELTRIASSSGLVFQVATYDVLQAINDQLVTAVCEEQLTTKTPPSSSSCINNNNGCIGKDDGNYRACDPECQEGYYYSCSNEFTYRMPCALGWYTSKTGTRFLARMMYNEVTDKCDLEAAYCQRDHEKYKQIPPKQNNQPTPSGSRPCLSSRDSCLGQPDGNYAKCYPECQDGFYFSCSNKETYVMPCALGSYKDKNGGSFTARMVYHAESDSCQLTTTSCPRDIVKQSSNPPTAAPPSGADTDKRIPVCHEKTDILIILDSSASIGKTNFDVMIIALAELTKSFQIGLDNVQFSFIVFSSDIHVLFSFSQFSGNKSGLYQAVLNAPYLEEGTDTALALGVARTYGFSSLNGARQGVGRVAVVVTDGISYDPIGMEIQASLLKASGVIVVAIGVGPGAVNAELIAIASFPDLIFEVDSFGRLAAIRKALVNTTCEIGKNTTSSCISNSCIRKADGNYPACKPECEQGYYYSCQQGYAYKMPCALGWYSHKNGTRFNARKIYNPKSESCEMSAGYCPREPGNHVVVPKPPTAIPSCTAKKDILVILDASASIGLLNYATQRTFVANLSTHFTIGQDAVQFSCIVFSTTSIIHFGFNAYTDNTAVWQGFLSVPYFSGGTNTAAALTLATDIAFSPVNGARNDVEKSVVMLTDGISQDASATALGADRLKRSGAEVFVIGIGLYTRFSELLAIASSPTHIFNVSNFDLLNSIARRLVKSTCQGSETQSSCVSGECGGRVDGPYVACDDGCKRGHYYVCSSGVTHKMTCGLTPYLDSNGSPFQARGVYDPTTKFCQASSTSCLRDPSDYRE